MCGIWGYSGNNFNKYKFNILGIYNDTRGGDSCGVFMKKDKSRHVEYGHDETKLYSKFIESGINLDFEDTKIAIGHCRKASIGGIGHAQAQPVVIRNKSGNIIFSMIHNGTLINYKELANKYNVNFHPEETDSQIFCKTVFRVGYKVLKEYDGAGAFIFWDSRIGENKMMVFKGASKYYQNNNTLYEERPLYAITNENSMWISSIEGSLKFINDEKGKIIDLDSNTLYTIENGNIVNTMDIDRSERKQLDNLVWGKNQPEVYGRGYYGNNWDEYDNGYWQSRREQKFDNKNDCVIAERGVLLDVKNTKTILPQKSKFKDKVYFDVDGLYKINDVPCNGEVKCSVAGYVNSSLQFLKTYYFLFGVMMKSYFDYLCAVEFCTVNFDDQMDIMYPLYISRYSTTPTPFDYNIIDGEDQGILFHISNPEFPDSNLEFTGKFSPYFCFNKETYTVKNGAIDGYVSYSSKNEYIMTKKQMDLDEKILSKKISDEELIQLINANI